MDIFLKQVREGLISKPTQNSFTLEKWNAAFDAIPAPTEGDKNLYEAGLWCFKKLELIREQLKRGERERILREDLVKLFSSIANRDFSLLHSQVQSALLSAIENDVYAIEGLIQTKVTIKNRSLGNAEGTAVNADAVVTTLVEALKYPLGEAATRRTDPSADILSATESLRRVLFMYALGQYYAAVELMWDECLWNGWFLFRRPQADMFFPPNTEKELSRAISHFRRYSLGMQTTQAYIRMWKTRLSEEMKQRIANDPKTVRVIGTLDNLRFEVRSNPGEVPTNQAYRALIRDYYFEEVLDFSLPKAGGLTIGILIDSWILLWELCEQIKAKLVEIENDSFTTAEELYRYCPIIQVKKLKTVLQKALGVTGEQARQILKFLTFHSMKHEFWNRPFVKLNDDKVIPILGAISSAYVLRVAEVWMKEGGLDLGGRGSLFEREVRQRLRSAVDSSKILRSAGVHPTGLEIGGEEIDLVVWLKNKIIICEAKCILSPSEPDEIHDYYRRLEGAAEQVKRKCGVARENRDNLLNRLGLQSRRAEEFKFIPLVVINYPIGAGLTIKGVPVVDLRILELYLGEAVLDRYVYISGDFSEETVGQSVKFYDSDETASTNIEGYLSAPPQLELFEKHVNMSLVTRLPPLDENDRAVLAADFSVEMAVDTSNFIIPSN
jgi:hypothetical protein